MASKKVIFSITLFLLTITTVFSQTRGSDISVYELMPIASVKLRVYHTKDEELKKIHLPNNFMIVKKPQEGKIYIWEFPSVIQKDDVTKKQEKELKEKEKLPDDTKPLAVPNNLMEISKQLGIGQIKEGTTADMLKSLLNK